MAIVKKIYLFFKHQADDLQEGGLCVFFRKVKKFPQLFLLRIFAPLAVKWGIHWPKAYLFMAYKFIKQYKTTRVSHRVNRKELEALSEKSINYMKKYIGYKPIAANLSDWINANNGLSFFLWDKGDINETIQSINRVMEIQNTICREHQLDKLDIVFIPRAFAIGAIGPYENVYSYIKAGILGLRPPQKMILLLEPDAQVNNRHYLNYFKQYISIITDTRLIELLSPLEKFLAVPLGLIMPIYGKGFISHLSFGLIQEQWHKEKRTPLLTLLNTDRQRGWQHLISLGVPQGAWFVCLHVRESGWRDEGSISEDYRNADINTYIPAIKAITSAGGWVIRIGDPGMKPLPEMSQVIDYAHSNIKSDWMDVFLCAECRFFIGTSSGPFTLAVAFGVPVLVTNLLPGHALYHLSSKDLFLPRLCWLEDEKRYLNFRELIAPPVGMASSKTSFEKLHLNIVPNDAEEIKDLVIEMLEKCAGKLKYSDEEENLQRCFKMMAAECGKLYGDERIVCNARIGRYFLSRHAPLLWRGQND
ncbi:MAG: TIGR04372 family glycosyltransferase [Candidatus Omnitrophota bacterium]|nr:TIGR04372 family glycosyltransferase [Candidatus Omnitrophota bacterium]